MADHAAAPLASPYEEDAFASIAHWPLGSFFKSSCFRAQSTAESFWFSSTVAAFASAEEAPAEGVAAAVAGGGVAAGCAGVAAGWAAGVELDDVNRLSL